MADGDRERTTATSPARREDPHGTQGPEAAYRRFLLDAFVAGPERARAVLAEIVAEDFVMHQARPGAEPSEAVRGPEALERLIRDGQAPFSDVSVSLDVGPVVDGDLVAGRWTFRGRYRGGVPGATAAPGTNVAFSGSDIVRVRDGRLAEYWVSSDGLDLMAQLGALGPG